MTQIGTIELVAKIDTSQYKKGASEIDAANKNIEDSSDVSANKTSNSWSKAAKVGLAAVAAAAVSVATIIISNFDNAIKRVDTLNNSARTFQNMGFNADQIKVSMEALTKSILGLPTSLDSAVRNVQLLASSTNDLGRSQKIFKALNDGILGFGGTAEQVDTAVIQLSQAFAGGKVMAQDWNSMLNAGLGPALNAIARQMGITISALKDGLSEGSISVESFQDALIDLDDKGGGGMASLDKIVKDSTSGIGTGFANMNTAITRGIASILKSIGPENISGAIANFGSSMEGALKAVSESVPKIVNGIAKIGDYLIPKLIPLVQTIKNDLLPAVLDLVKAIGPPLGAGLVGVLGFAITALNILLTALSPLISFLSDNTWIVWGIVGAFVAFKTALLIESAVKSFQVGVAGIMFAMELLSGQAVATTGKISAVRLALQLLTAGPWQIILGVVVLAGAIAALKEISEWLDKVLNKWAKAGDIGIGGKIKVDSNSSAGLTQRLMDAFNGFRAGGGPVTAGKAYIVGENQPEVFVPNTSGMILPEVPTSSGGDISITLNLSGIMARSKADLRDIGKDILKAVNQEIVAQGKPAIGGLA